MTTWHILASLTNTCFVVTPTLLKFERISKSQNKVGRKQAAEQMLNQKPVLSKSISCDRLAYCSLAALLKDSAGGRARCVRVSVMEILDFHMSVCASQLIQFQSCKIDFSKQFYLNFMVVFWSY